MIALVAAAIIFAYNSVILKLSNDWWTDENYSHGLLVPFVIGFIIWSERKALRDASTRGEVIFGSAITLFAVLMLAAGTLGAELFTQRISLLILISGIVIYSLGRKILNLLLVPFVLLFLAIPIPQIVFNQIAFPLQILASKLAVWGIRIVDVPVTRSGNVIDILPSGSTQTISLEVVEACSGIRSLSTLITLALILVYFTSYRVDRGSADPRFGRSEYLRAAMLMIAAVPIAVVTNATRVSATGIMTYYFGKSASEGIVHEVSGWLVYVSALAIMLALNAFLKAVFREADTSQLSKGRAKSAFGRSTNLLPLVVLIIASGCLINWYVHQGETVVPRTELSGLPQTLGDWHQKGSEFRFDADVESVLGASDYTMREYSLPDGRIANLYVGFYASQRTGRTYHSPLNCLPGAGWVMKDPETIEIKTADGRSFIANQYIIENGIYRELMLYWYQGRGRTENSEYRDKINTVADSVIRRRTDGAMIRVMTSVGSDETSAENAAADLAARLEEHLDPFIPK